MSIPFPRFAASNQPIGQNECEGLGPKLEPNRHAYSALSEEGFWTTHKGHVLPDKHSPRTRAEGALRGGH